MYIGWFKDIPDEDKADHEKIIRSALLALDQFDGMLKNEIDMLDRQECDPTTYDTPNWAYRQAHKNGARAAYEKMRKIISLS
jgi:hypothetical protein